MRPINILPMILAGGIGERLYPLTSNRCKPAVPFGGNFRIIDFTLMNCVCSGLRKIHVLTQYHAQSLNRHRVERWNFLASELGEYIEMVPPKMRGASGYYHGTAHAIYRNLEMLDQYRPDVVLVLSGDHIYRADYMRFIQTHVERDADVTVLSDWVDARECSSFGVLTLGTKGEISGFVEKPQDPMPYAHDGKCLINLGVYCFRTEFLVQALVQDAKKRTPHDFGRNILPGAVGHASVLPCPLQVISPDRTPYWRDVGNIDSYFQANMDLLKVPAPFELIDPRWPSSSRFYDWIPALCSATVRIGGRTVHGRNVISSAVRMEHAKVVNCVLSSRVRIGADCELEDCIVFEGAEVGRGTKLRRVIVEEGVRIPEGMKIGFGGDSEQFTTSPGGIVVISGRYRFSELDEIREALEIPASEVTKSQPKEAQRKPARPREARPRQAPPIPETPQHEELVTAG